jgi:hypothetical protein
MKEEKGLSAPIIYWTNLLPFPEVEDLVSRPSIPRMEAIARKCREKGIFPVVNENVTCEKPMRGCTKWNEPFVLVSGHIQPCCALNEANDRKYQEEHAFANVLETHFHDWWNSAGKKIFLRNLRSGIVNPVCKNCHIFRHPQSEANISIRDYERARQSGRSQGVEVA